MHDKKTTNYNFSDERNHKHQKTNPIEKTRMKHNGNFPQTQVLPGFGLAVLVSSIGVTFSLPQTVTAAPTNTLVSNNYSSTINLGTDSAATVTVPQLPSFSVAQNPAPKTITQQIYTVQPGDTIDSIARLHNVSRKKILEANQIKNPNRLSVNDQLVIPLEASAQVVSGNVELSFASNNSDAVAFSPRNATAAKTSGSKIMPRVTRDISGDLSTNQDNLRNPYISKLRNDIDKLRNQFQNQYSEDSSPVSIQDSSSPVDSRFSATDNLPSTIPAVNQEGEVSTLDKSYSSEEVVISSTTSSPGNYNPLFSTPLRNRLNPQLPPLSSPEEYLPNFFNGYIWPAQGTFTSGYGWRWGRMHRGIDIAAPIGTPIFAAATGEVIFAGWNSGGYGNLVKLKHSDGSVTLYAHNNKILVHQGQKIKQGQQIAEMGSTGFSTGPHLHFEIRPNGTKAIDPIALLPQK